MAGKAIPELQQAVRANPKDSEALGALGQAYSQKGDRANAVANLEKPSRWIRTTAITTNGTVC